MRTSVARTETSGLGQEYQLSQSRHVLYNTIGTVVTLFCQWLIMMLIPRMTDFSEAGIFTVAISICSIVSIFSTFSLHQYQIADQYVNYDENTYRVARILTILFSFVICIAIISFMDYSVKQNILILVYMTYRNILHFAYLYTADLQINNRLDYAGKCMIIEGIVSLASFIGVYNLTNDLILSTVAMTLLGGGSFLLLTAIGYKKYTLEKISVKKTEWCMIKSLMKMGIPLLLSGVAPIVITALPKLILQIYEGDEIIGIFGTLSAPTVIVPTVITSIFVPFIIFFSNIARSGNLSLLRSNYIKSVGMILGFGVLCIVISTLGAEYAFTMLYGDQIRPYVHYFNILIMGITFYSVGMIGITVLMTKEQGRAAAIISLFVLFISVPIFISLISEYGISGASYGLVLVYGIFGFLISLGVLHLPLTHIRRDASSEI